MNANNSNNKDETDNIKISQKMDVNDTPLSTPETAAGIQNANNYDDLQHVPAATPRKAKNKIVDDNLNVSGSGGQKEKWVKFEEEIDLSSNGDTIIESSFEDNSIISESPPSVLDTISSTNTTQSPHTNVPAVLRTESVHVNIDNNNRLNSSPKTHLNNQNVNKTMQPAVIDLPKKSSNMTTSTTASVLTETNAPIDSRLRTIELSTGRIREGFANGDVIVTLLPINTNWPWITPAVFRPELVPEELMAQGLTLTVEEYVHAMETLVNDYRFTVYNICYKRVLVCWILFAFCVLLGLLFSGLTGLTLFSLGVGWLFLNAAAIFLCIFVKVRLARGLERCLARVNKQLIRHKIIVALDDRGNISCHKVTLCFIYFEPSQCISYLNTFIERNEQNGTTIEPGWEARLDVSSNDIVIQGANTTRLSRKQGLAEGLFLRYLQRWGKDFLRRRLDWTIEEAGMSSAPRHLQTAFCPCQYAEEVLLQKPKKDPRSCCASCTTCGVNFC